MDLPDFVGMPYERVLNALDCINPKPHVIWVESRAPVNRISEGSGFSAQKRVIRQKQLENGALELTVAAFRRDPVTK